MNEENTLKLLDTFPKLYCNFHANYRPERKVQFEFQCRDGWFNLVWEMSQKLEAEIISMEKTGSAKLPSAIQLKEKFGILRVYMTDYPKSVNEIIKEAVNRSEVTCEVCGEPGTLRDERKWQITLCDDHKND